MCCFQKTRDDITNNPVDEILLKARDYSLFDWEAANAILDNCKRSEYDDCRRLLLSQKDELITEIYYEKMFDENGDENDFIPTGCTYEHLLAMLLSCGGVQEKDISVKKDTKIRMIIKAYKKAIEIQVKTIKQNKELIAKQEEIINSNKVKKQTRRAQKQPPKVLQLFLFGLDNRVYAR